jgi:hypothetical protein
MRHYIEHKGLLVERDTAYGEMGRGHAISTPRQLKPSD